MKRSLTLLLLLPCLALPASGADNWLPEDGRESLSSEIAARLGTTRLSATNDEAQLLATARSTVDSIISTIDTWGGEELANRAPELDELELPASENVYLDAIARYGACNFHLEALYGNLALDESAPSIRVSAAIASAAIPLATANLRHHFQAAGGTDDELRAYLTSEAMAAASQRIKDNREMISYSWRECAPTISALTEKATALLTPSGDESDAPGSP